MFLLKSGMESENHNIEYKATWRDEYLKWICGFANAHGGKMLIGVDDKGYVVGVEKPKKLIEDIGSAERIRDLSPDPLATNASIPIAQIPISTPWKSKSSVCPLVECAKTERFVAH